MDSKWRKLILFLFGLGMLIWTHFEYFYGPNSIHWSIPVLPYALLGWTSAEIDGFASFLKVLFNRGGRMMIRRLKSALVWLIGGAVAFNAGLQLIPGEAFMTVRNIYVADAWYGQTPVMQVSRTIRKAFWAEWSVELEERTELGQYIFVAKAAGSNSYTPESKLPKAFTLDWWTFPTQLRPARGVYRIETCWEIRTQGFPVKEVCKHSNDFRIK